MSARHRTSAWLFACVLPLLAVSCRDRAPHPLRVTQGDLSARRLARGERATLVDGRAMVAGDYLLSSKHLHVLVGGPARVPTERGAVLEARLRDDAAGQSLSYWAFGLSFNDRAVPLTFRDVFLVERPGRVVLRIETVAKVASRVVHIDRELSLSDLSGVIGVATSLWTEQGESNDPIEGLRVIERLDWDGAAPFAPGVGEIADEKIHRVSWVAREGRASAAMLGYVNGPVHVQTSYQPHGAERLPGTTRTLSPRGTLTPGTALRFQSFFVLARYGVSDAVRHYGWARGTPFGQVSVRVPYLPAGTLVRVYGADGSVLMRGRPAPDGTLLMPLPDVVNGDTSPKLTIAATAWGHAATTPRRVRDGDSVSLEIPRGGSVHVVVRDPDGRNIPARIRFESLDKPAKKIDLGPDHNAGGARDSVITISGDVVVPLMPGKFRVRVTRGPEYDVFEQAIEVTESFQPQVSVRLSRVIDPGPWVGADFHLHSSPSPDSQVTLEDRVASLTAEGVRFAVPTDHDHVTSLLEAIAALKLRDFGTLSGLEVTTSEPVIGHFNAYPYPLDPAKPGNGALEHHGLHASEIFARLHEASTNPLVQVNHPRMEHGIGYFDAYEHDPSTGHAKQGFSEDYDVLEVWNGFDLARPEVFERVFQDWMWILRRGRRVIATGNSDSHTIRSQWAGYPRTFIHAPAGPSDPDALMTSLRAGRAFVSDGPFLDVTIDQQGPGALVTANDKQVIVNVLVRAAPWMDMSQLDIWVGGELVHKEPIVVKPLRVPASRGVAAHDVLPIVRLRKAIKLAIREDTFVIVRVRGDKPMDAYFGRNAIPPLAFSNPIFVDADHDGAVRWLPTPPPSDAGALQDGGAKVDAAALRRPLPHRHAGQAHSHTHGDASHQH